MLKYLVLEIGGKQYKVQPQKPFLIDFREGKKEVEAKLLLFVKDGKVEVGKPYLEKKLQVLVLGNELGRKLKVAKYHAKANYRRVVGFRPKLTKVVIDTSFPAE